MREKMRRTRSAGGIVLNAKHQVLVVQQNKNSWSLPKGHVDPGESALEAARREIREEAGITDLDLLRDLGAYSRAKIGQGGLNDLSEMKVMRMFLFKTDSAKLKLCDPAISAARWLSPEAAVQRLTHPRDRAFLLAQLSLLHDFE
jgi:8-oxo-dGTP pyrophosphatase MutT (NUDIX family)